MNRILIAQELIKVARLLVGEEMTPEEKARRQKKVESLRTLADNIIKLRRRVNKDLSDDNEKTRLTALVITIMDKTAERVGNEESMKNGHVGVTGFKKKHIKVDGNTVHFNYVGKSGVKQDKQLTDERIASMLKKCLDRAKGPEDCVFCTEDGFKVKADKVNRYLDEFGVTAKDIRGYAANRFMIEALKNAKISSDEDERKKKFREVIKTVAEKVGHGAGTLRKHYLLPNIEMDYVKKGNISNIRDATVIESA
jgi:DNA topoisomerase I